MFPFVNISTQQGGTCDPRPLLGGAAVSFDGVSGYISGTYASITQVSHAFKFRLDDYSLSSFRYIYSHGGGVGNNSRYSLALNGSTGEMYFYNGGGSKVHYTGFTPVAGTWYSIVMVVDQTIDSLKIYVDGVKIVDVTTSFTMTTPTTAMIVIGTLDPAGSLYFMLGSYYGVQVFDSLLTDQEITDIYNNEKLDGDLFWKLDERSGSVAFDSSGNGNNGTLTGGYSHVTTTEYSYSDKLGYSDGTGIYLGAKIPRDESNQEFDVLGNELEYKGEACGA